MKVILSCILESTLQHAVKNKMFTKLCQAENTDICSKGDIYFSFLDKDIKIKQISPPKYLCHTMMEAMTQR